MPELPEVETVRRGMAQIMTGRTITGLVQRRPDLRVPFPERLKARTEGQVIDMLTRRAKYILMHLSGGEVLILHLGMSGRVLLLPPEKTSRAAPPYDPQKHDHLLMTLDNGAQMVFNDARRFGFVLLAPSSGLDAHPSLASLGPEPLGNDFSAPLLQDRFRGRTALVKTMLLDQRIVAGLGNIYVCEALYEAGIDPRRPAGTINEGECTLLAAAIRAVLEKAIAAGGSTLRDHRQADGSLGYFQHQFSVYDRAGMACPLCRKDGSLNCAVERIIQAGRATYFCAERQK